MARGHKGGVHKYARKSKAHGHDRVGHELHKRK